MWADAVNACFEALAGLFIGLSVLRLHRDKLVRGVSPVAVGFFALWGCWNLYYYPSLGQWSSFAGGVLVVIANTVWVAQIVYYLLREKAVRRTRQ